MGYYYSLYEWYNPTYHADVDKYVDEHMLPQMKDLVTSYEPDILWTDGEWDHPSKDWKSTEFLAWLFNESPVGETVAVNDRWGKETRGKHGGYYTTEYGLVHADEAEEVVHEVFMKVIENIDNFRGDASPTTWLWASGPNLSGSSARYLVNRHWV